MKTLKVLFIAGGPRGLDTTRGGWVGVFAKVGKQEFLYYVPDQARETQLTHDHGIVGLNGNLTFDCRNYLFYNERWTRTGLSRRLSLSVVVLEER